MERTEPTNKLNPWVLMVGGVAAVAGTAALVSLFGPQSLRFLPLNQSIPTVVISVGALALVAGSLTARGTAAENTSEAFKREEEIDVKDYELPEIQDDPEVLAILKNYLKEHPTDLSLRTILRLADKGWDLTDKMLDGYEVEKSPENAQAVLWYFLVNQLHESRRGYDSWTWKIVDPKGKLTQFFQEIPGGYDRISTHFEGLDKGPQKGIDFPPGVLPGGKQSALVVALNPEKYHGETVLAIKLEAWGMGSREHQVMHGCDYIKSLIRKLLNQNDGENSAKEHAPKICRLFGYKRVCELVANVQLHMDELRKLGSDLHLRDGKEHFIHAIRRRKN